MSFKKTKENFVCENCGKYNVGNGFTSHCSKCLWSKHVDIDPGDRMEICSGIMEPIGVESKNGGWRIMHRCKKCRFERLAPVLPGDNFEEVLAIAKKLGNTLH